MKKRILTFFVLFIVIITFTSCDSIYQSNLLENEKVEHPYLKFKETETECYVVDCDESVVLVEIPEEYNNKPVTRIEHLAFYNCVSLFSVKIPNTITFIGESAFSNCVSLRGINIPDSVLTIERRAFNNCSWLEVVNLPKNLTNIAEGMFTDCKSLEDIIIPNSVQTIEADAFMWCESLESIVFLSNSNLEFIGKSAFSYCEKLSYVNFEKTKLKRIENNAFFDCYSLHTVELPPVLDYIGSAAFFCCEELGKIVIPKSVTKIDFGAFAGCNDLYVYCEADSKPTEWDKNWSDSVKFVKWGYVAFE